MKIHAVRQAGTKEHENVTLNSFQGLQCETMRCRNKFGMTI